jgi:trehalose 6-phosphate synthase/phosphatase
MNRLIISSNRLPVTVKLDRGEVVVTSSAGGLATGLGSLHEKSDSLWVGWPGDVSRFDPSQQAEIERKLTELRSIPVHLTQAEISRYYEGFSNGVLWPLFHYLADIVEREAWRNWLTYQAVNRRFAEAIAASYSPGTLVWIHDYQLLLVPRLLRSMIPDARIGLFLHIPFPSSEVFRILPWRAEILDGMLGADLIGFHTYSYLTHFSRALLHVLDLKVESESLEFDNREIRLGVFPMGIDAGAFADLANTETVNEEITSIKDRSRGRKLIVGVDRLDHTKGLARRMLAVERLFEREPSLRRRLRFVQVVVPSRTRVDAYAQLRRRLDEIVGRINGAYGTVNSVPIHYLYRSINRAELVALYRAADVMLVTPLRDGMNLVAKEFVASRVDEDGVLVLSEFAGAASEMAEAIHVNPYDLDRVAMIIKDALTMPEEERVARMRALRRRVRDYDVFRWANAFIDRLASPFSSAIHSRHAVSPAEDIAIVSDKLREADRLLILLDYDGTLIPFASTPELAAPDPELKKLLLALSGRPRTSVHVLSGRTRQTLDHWLGDLPIGLHAEHGFWSRNCPGVEWEPIAAHPLQWKQKIKPLLKQFTEATPGSLIEEKTAGLAWHYRMADPVFGDLHARELRRKLEKEHAELPIDVVWGDKVIEIRAQGINKGVIATRLISSFSEPTTVLAMGNDRTDEDLFAALDSNSYSVHIGPHPSQAAYRLSDPSAARSLLASLLERKGGTCLSESSDADDLASFEARRGEHVKLALRFSQDAVR